MHDAIGVTGSPLCMRAWLHTYACSSWQRRPVCLVSGLHINPCSQVEEITAGFPSCSQPFSVLTALLLTKTCLPLWLPGRQRSAACWRVVLRSQASREPRPALKAASHHTEDPGGRQRETPQKQLEVRWLFHVFISQWRAINLDWHSLEHILCVCVCMCVFGFLLRRKMDKAKEQSVSFPGVHFI